jgi:hypothetical protein
MKKDLEYYHYKVIHPFKVFNLDLKIDDLATRKQVLELPPIYRQYFKDLSSPIVKK